MSVRFTVLVLACAAAWFGAARLLPWSPKASPERHFEEPKVFAEKDHGVVPEGTILKHRFTLAPAGSTATVVESVRSSCGCRADVGERTVIDQPLVLDVVCDTRMLEGDVSRDLVVVTAAPGPRQLLFRIRTHVVPEFILSTYVVDLGQSRAEATVERVIELQVNADPSVRPLSAHSTDPLVAATLRPVDYSGARRFELVITRAPVDGPRIHRGKIVIRTSSGAKPEVRVPVRGEIES
jgi:hypothetical protein